MAVYDIVVRAFDESELGKVVSLVSGYGLAIQSVKPVEPARKQQGKHSKHRVLDKTKITGEALLEELFKKQKSWNSQDIKAEFIKRGFSKNTSSPKLAEASQAGKIKRVALGEYERA